MSQLDDHSQPDVRYPLPETGEAHGPHLNLMGTTPAEAAGHLAVLGEPAYRGHQITNWMYRHRVFSFDAMTNLNKELRSRLEEKFTIAVDTPQAVQSSPDGTEKLLFERDGDRWETVLMRDGPRRTVCISSQSGCALGCRFCATAKLGLRRNLTSGEMVGQILRAGELLPKGERVTNLVFMGMGEPLQNYETLRSVLEIVGADWGLDISLKKTTVSTVGLVPAMDRWAEEGIRAKLAISLIVADDELRSQLMPINRKHPLSKLKRAAIAVAEASGRRVTFEYVLLDGVNDSIAHAKKLVHFIEGVPCKINLIRFHPHPGSEFRRPPEDRVAAFRDYLYPRCPAVNVRKSFGVDIDAACGQLAGRA